MEINLDIKEKFFEIISTRPAVSSFIMDLQSEGDVLLFGGCVREYFDTRYSILPRDFDMVINSYNGLDTILTNVNCNYEKNRFGGYKVVINDLKFDLWEIHNTWAFKNKKIEFKHLEDLCKTVFLNIDAILYNLNTNELYKDGYYNALLNKELDIVLEDNPFPDLNVIRAFKLKKRYDMKFSKDFNNYLYMWFNKYEDQVSATSTLQKIEYERYNSIDLDWNEELKFMSYNK